MPEAPLPAHSRPFLQWAKDPAQAALLEYLPRVGGTPLKAAMAVFLGVIFPTPEYDAARAAHAAAVAAYEQKMVKWTAHSKAYEKQQVAERRVAVEAARRMEAKAERAESRMRTELFTDETIQSVWKKFQRANKWTNMSYEEAIKRMPTLYETLRGKMVELNAAKAAARKEVKAAEAAEAAAARKRKAAEAAAAEPKRARVLLEDADLF